MHDERVAVVGATGHTGRFVLDELKRRGRRSILIARDRRKLALTAAEYPQSEARVADIADPRSLDAALAGATVVINCAGPFLDTAIPVFEAALRARISYIDVTAEQAVVRAIYARDVDARRVGVIALPATAFFGGLSDLLATSIVVDLKTVDHIDVAVALDRWHPTQGTRLTGARNTAARLIVRDGLLQPLADPEPTRSWQFPEPFGMQDVDMVPLSETITLAHLEARTIQSWINRSALRDVGDPATPPPQPSDDRGRSSQRFVMDVAARTGAQHRRIRAFGRDIYAVSAPIVVEAVERLLGGDGIEPTGTHSLGTLFDADAFLNALIRSGDIQLRRSTSNETEEVYVFDEGSAMDSRSL